MFLKCFIYKFEEKMCIVMFFLTKNVKINFFNWHKMEIIEM